MKRKFLYFAALAAIVLPLMVACKGEEPTEYERQVDEVMDILKNGDGTDVLAIESKNFVGIWHYLGRGEGQTVDASKIVSFGLQPNRYYVLNADGTGKEYRISDSWGAEFTNIIDGTWKLDGEELQLKFGTYNSLDNVLSITQGHLITYYENTDSSLGLKYIYNVYERIESLPELPKTAEEVLMSGAWELQSDSVIYKKIDENPYAETVVSTKVNQLPKKLHWIFSQTGFEEIDAENNVLHEGNGKSSWNASERELSLSEDYPITDLYKSLGIDGTFEGFSDHVAGEIYFSSDHSTLRFVHNVRSLSTIDPYKNPVEIVLTFKIYK